MQVEVYLVYVLILGIGVLRVFWTRRLIFQCRVLIEWFVLMPSLVLSWCMNEPAGQCRYIYKHARIRPEF